MRSIERVLRALGATVTGSLCAVLPALVAPDRVYAAPGCQAPPAPSATTNEIPWAQQRQGLDRLAGLADGTGVLVAVVDSGVEDQHPQLAGAVAPGFDRLDPDSDGRIDCVGHGTAVASIIAGRVRPGTAFRGVAPAATVLPVRVSERVTDETGGRAASLADVATAVRQAVDRGARVVNLSLTTDRDDPGLRDAVRYARSRDAVLVAAAGNRQEAGNPRVFPASYDGVVGVGGVQTDGARVATSQTGPHVDLVAPGADVIAAGRVGHARYTGTSFAAAFVAGTAALVRQYHPGLTADQVTERLLATADTLDPDPASGLGAGIVNPYRAVTASLDGTTRAAPGPVTPRSADPNALRTAARTAENRRTAIYVALGGAAVLVLLLVAASARRAGTARGGPAPGR
jgi:type VII secretion-associated serine protease mycosin